MNRIAADARPPSPFGALLSAGPSETVLRLTGEFDLAAEDAAFDAVGRAWATDPDRLVLDLTGLTFLASAGVRCLRAAQATADSRNRPLHLVVGPASRRTLELSGVLPRFSSSAG